MSNRITVRALAAVTITAVAAGTLGLASAAPGHAADTTSSRAADAPETTYLILRPNENGVDSDPVLAGSFTYKLHTTFVNFGEASSSLVVTANAGVTGTIAGKYRLSDDFGDVDQTPRTFIAKIAPTATFTVKAGFSGDATALFDTLAVTGSDGTRQKVTLKVRVDNKLQATGERFLITGRVEDAS